MRKTPSTYAAVDGGGKLIAQTWHEDIVRKLVFAAIYVTPWWQKSILRRVPVLRRIKQFQMDWRVEREVERHLETVADMKRRAERDGGQAQASDSQGPAAGIETGSHDREPGLGRVLMADIFCQDVSLDGSVVQAKSALKDGEPHYWVEAHINGADLPGPMIYKCHDPQQATKRANNLIIELNQAYHMKIERELKERERLKKLEQDKLNPQWGVF
ncbi:hypothetical protein GCM10011316_21690 [Roseibium aquae]|uniref:Uncharacterized protein n=1 Tax=Roseibium aquae TaxID=1323746 RepID=A0A916TK62_9HYPH|nr:hypothetical protein [Roseibium aquae]GGB49227.1 hypothetical protein GCM10011316_21690 [Roseibium aquae]